jgi:hypothetical protein
MSATPDSTLANPEQFILIRLIPFAFPIFLFIRGMLENLRDENPTSDQSVRLEPEFAVQNKFALTSGF